MRVLKLRRMKMLATGLLAVMALIFVLASYAQGVPGVPYVRAFAEAAMVGACADWFAVTALFRHPLGLPIPHTAIIPRSKGRIGAALGRFIVENFLNSQVLDAKLHELELAAWGGEWLQVPENAQSVACRFMKYGPELLRALPTDALEGLAGSCALAIARAIPAAPTASALLAALWNEGRAQPLVDRGAELLGDYLAEHQDIILEKVQAQSWRWLPIWVDRAIARKITQGLVQLLADVRQPDHPWRSKLAGVVEGLIVRLADDEDMRRRGEALKQQLLDDPRLAGQARRLWSEIRRQLETGGWAQTAAFEPRIGALVGDLGQWLCGDDTIQGALNAGARSMVRDVLAPRRERIGLFVAQVVEGWHAQDVVERLELQVGSDLQFIRVNGTLVGGLVGLALFALSRALGLA